MVLIEANRHYLLSPYDAEGSCRCHMISSSEQRTKGVVAGCPSEGPSIIFWPRAKSGVTNVCTLALHDIILGMVLFDAPLRISAMVVRVSLWA